MQISNAHLLPKHRISWVQRSCLLTLLFAFVRLANANQLAKDAASAAIVVVGSLNMDVIVEVDRLPNQGETITARTPVVSTAVGGKGANQAVAAARLSAEALRKTKFICQIGNDSYASELKAALINNGVDISGCIHADLPSGHGIVLLQPDGTATSIVLGGANTMFSQDTAASWISAVRRAGVVLLQREVPEHVNQAAATAASAAGVPVLLDVGGEDRPLSDSLLQILDYVMPNESELARLTGMSTESDEAVLQAAKSLIRRGARGVIVTLAERGAMLVSRDGQVLRQAALPVPGGSMVDATAAGDAFRAAFAVSLVEGRPLDACLQFAAAAGALTVASKGAVPSLPGRVAVEKLLAEHQARSGASGRSTDGPWSVKVQGQVQLPAVVPDPLPDTCERRGGDTCSARREGSVPSRAPYKFASRLNSMRGRRDLANTSNTVVGWIARQGQVQGLSLVDLNHPQHTQGHTPARLREALRHAGLTAGAVCLRFPEAFTLGAFTNPLEERQREAVQLAVEGCRWAQELGARDLIVWSPYDGYDYFFQMDYQQAWERTVESFQQLADACPSNIRVSLEFKPTDETTRFSIVPTTGAALLLARDVGRPNFGLTLDFGHMLIAGENPAQSVALAGQEGKLFGLQLNDAHVRLGAEDGLAFASVNPVAALEMVRWLQRVEYDGHIFFDTFPLKEDPVREAEYNIRRFNALWEWAARLQAAGMDSYTGSHDALGVLELLDAIQEKGAT